MNELKETFVMFKSHVDSINALPVENQLEVYKAIAHFGFTGEISADCSPVTRALVIAFAVPMQKTATRYQKRKDAAKKGGAPVGNTNASKDEQAKCEQKTTENNQKQPNESKNNLNDDANVDVNANVDVINKEKRENRHVNVPSHTKFTKPTLDELNIFCQKSGLCVDSQAFIDFYDSKGWLIGKNPMKDWQASVRSWARRPQYGGGNVQQTTKTTNPFLNLAMEVQNEQKRNA